MVQEGLAPAVCGSTACSEPLISVAWAHMDRSDPARDVSSGRASDQPVNKGSFVLSALDCWSPGTSS